MKINFKIPDMHLRIPFSVVVFSRCRNTQLHTYKIVYFKHLAIYTGVEERRNFGAV